MVTPGRYSKVEDGRRRLVSHLCWIGSDFFFSFFSLSLTQRRIKKIMQKDAQVGRIAMAVPVIICILQTRKSACRPAWAAGALLKCVHRALLLSTTV